MTQIAEPSVRRRRRVGWIAAPIALVVLGLIGVLATYDIEAFRDPVHTGVWTTSGKIAAMGIRVSAGVSLHGFALNANTDLAYFGLIVPCGIQGRAVASMQQILGTPVDMELLMDRIAAAFAAPAPAGQRKETVA